MDRQDIAIVVNTCPKYFYLLDAYFGLLRRYAEDCKWPLYLATEAPTHPTIEFVVRKYSLHLLPLEVSDADFLQSRAAAIRALPPSIQIVLPLQDDFLLERTIDTRALTDALRLLDTEPTVQSIRLMPCPGASSKERIFGGWNRLRESDLLFSYQATLFRRSLYQRYMDILIQQGLSMFPELKPGTPDWNRYCIQQNPAETRLGLAVFQDLDKTGVHLCWPRKAAWPNAVFWSPWPYRPTAVVRGTLQPWADELIRREGFSLSTQRNM
jgi:hypothetical protein